MTGPLSVGTRVVLTSMPEDPDPIEPGTCGVVTGGASTRLGQQIWVKWDDGRTLNLIPGTDTWKVIGHTALDPDPIPLPGDVIQQGRTVIASVEQPIANSEETEFLLLVLEARPPYYSVITMSSTDASQQQVHGQLENINQAVEFFVDYGGGN